MDNIFNQIVTMKKNLYGGEPVSWGLDVTQTNGNMSQVFSWASPWNHDNRCSPCPLLTDEVHDWTGVNNRSLACPEHNSHLKCMFYPDPASKDTTCNRLFSLVIILLASRLPLRFSGSQSLSCFFFSSSFSHSNRRTNTPQNSEPAGTSVLHSKLAVEVVLS